MEKLSENPVLDAENLLGAMERFRNSLHGYGTIPVDYATRVEPDRFNRVPFSIGGRSYMASFFIPADTHPSSNKSPAENEVVYEAPLTFESDYRRTNPKLHRLYLKWALEELEKVNQFIEEMSEFTRFTASVITSAVIEKVGHQIMNDAAWFEAAGLIQAKVDLTPYLSYDEEVHQAEELARVQS